MKERITIETEITFRCRVTADYSPGRPAPPCSNPDSPAFSDSGDPSECEFVRVEVQLPLQPNAPQWFEVPLVALDLLPDEEDRIHELVYEQHQAASMDDEGDRIDHAYDTWRDRQMEDKK